MNTAAASIHSSSPSYRAWIRAGLSAGAVVVALWGWHGTASASTAAAQGMQIQPPPSTQMVFDVKGRVSGIAYSATAQIEWTAGNGRYRAFQQVRMPLLGARSQTSSGRIGPLHLQPETFEDSRRNRILRFDPTAHTVVYHQAQTATPIPADSQDRLSVFFQLASLVAAQPQTFVAGKQVKIPTVSFNKQDYWTFEVVGTETLSLSAGAMDTVKLRRLPRKADDQTAEIWLSPSMQYLPVRIAVREDDGDALDLRLQKHTRAVP